MRKGVAWNGTCTTELSSASLGWHWTSPAAHTHHGRRSQLSRAEAELQQTITDLRPLAQGIYPVLLKDAGLAVALRALSESRHLRVDHVPPQRFPDVLESTLYLFVARASEHTSAAVAVDAGDQVLAASMLVEGGMPDLADLDDRITTLAGQLNSDSENGSTRLTLTLPLRST